MMSEVIDSILSIDKSGPILVGIDGVDGAGKSTFAENLVYEMVSKTKRKIYHSSVDYFHHPRHRRRPEGKNEALSFFEDSFNYQKLKELLLDPLKNNLSKMIQLKYFDHSTDQVVMEKALEYDPNSILVFDGIFVHRDELYQYWDYSVFLDVDFETTFKRMALRDGCPENHLDPKNARYYQGQLIYLDHCRPKTRATTVF